MEEWKKPYKYIKTENLLTYVASDGRKFTDRRKYMEYEYGLTELRRKWYDKRFSTWNRFRHWLTGYEPPKPYKF